MTAERVDRLRKAVFASPGDLRGAAVRLTQFGPDAPAHLVEHVGNLSERASSQVWTDGLSGLMEMDLRYALPRVTVPTLVVVGQHDRITPPAASVALAGELPDATLVVLEGAGHVAMMERPVELDREIRAFSRKLLMPASTKRRPKDRVQGAARMTRTLEQAAAEAASCTKCRLAEGRTQVVYGVGAPDADLLFIGEGPGFHEDKQGEPFVGAAGQLLTKHAPGHRAGAFRGLHREHREVPAARQPRSAARRDRGLHAVARRADLV